MAIAHCARCGYLVQYHDIAKRCPGLKTGRWQDADPIDRTTWREIMARDLAARIMAHELDPEKWRNGTPEAKRKLFLQATRIVTGAEPDPRTLQVIEGEPMVPARPPRSPYEFAAYQGRQAAGLGRQAVAAGFQVAPIYWRAGDGSEGCAVKGRRAQTFAFVATWKRPAGRSGTTAGWGADIAYVWNPQDRTHMPSKITHTQLEEML